MNWKTPPIDVFFVPVPLIDQQLTKLAGQIFILNGNEPFRVIDYLGAYPFEKIPNWIARAATGKAEITGQQLAALLKKKIPEFRNAEKVLFLQLFKETL